MMTAKLTQPVLVLNKNWSVIGTSPVYKVINLLLSGPQAKAHVIDDMCTPYTWDEWSQFKPENEHQALSTVNKQYKIPEVIKLAKYDRHPSKFVIFSRANIFKRDEYKCQYCGIKPGSEELTIDHVIPRCQGGQTTWQNCVLSCIECNSIKGGRLLKEIKNKKFPSGMNLLKTPIKPKVSDLKFHLYHKSWKQWLDNVYWNIELENQNEQ